MPLLLLRAWLGWTRRRNLLAGLFLLPISNPCAIHPSVNLVSRLNRGGSAGSASTNENSRD
jgi:hypothetical protein